MKILKNPQRGINLRNDRDLSMTFHQPVPWKHSLGRNKDYAQFNLRRYNETYPNIELNIYQVAVDYNFKNYKDKEYCKQVSLSLNIDQAKALKEYLEFQIEEMEKNNG